MRKSTLVFMTSAVLVIGLVSLGAAQMMGGDQGHMSQMKADSMSQQGQTDMMGMMHNMSDHCKMMATDFDSLQQHFNSMMQMNDMSALKSEMKKHQSMMQAMHDNMAEQKSKCQNMMSMMHSGGMQSMMGMKGDDAPGNAEEHSHDH